MKQNDRFCPSVSPSVCPNNISNRFAKAVNANNKHNIIETFMYLIQVKTALDIIFSYQAIGSTAFQLVHDHVDGIWLAVTMHPEGIKCNDILIILYILYFSKANEASDRSKCIASKAFEAKLCPTDYYLGCNFPHSHIWFPMEIIGLMMLSDSSACRKSNIYG